MKFQRHGLKLSPPKVARVPTRPVALFVISILATALTAYPSLDPSAQQNNERPRAREAGVKVGILPVGPLNAITDVRGVMVGHATLARGDNIRTGVTAVLPHNGNLFREKVPGAVFVGNGFGKLMGSTQIRELGEIETPILLTATLSVPRVADFLLDYMLSMPGNEDVQSVNALVAETNDGYLNDIRGRHISRDDVFAAIKNARTGPVEEGAVGAGTGTVAFGFKGGVGTSSRRIPASLGGFTVGVLVQTNFGGILTINGAPVGRELGEYYLKNQLSGTGFSLCSPVIEQQRTNQLSGTGFSLCPPALEQKRTNQLSGTGFSLCPPAPEQKRTNQLSGTGFSLCSPVIEQQRINSGACFNSADGSVIIVIATDAPVDARNLERMAARAMTGLARTGSAMTNGSGDYAIAFSTSPDVRLRTAANQSDRNAPRSVKSLPNDSVSPLFLAVIEATEEAIYNSLFRATTMSGRGRTVEALPIERTLEILRKHAAIEK